MPYFDNIPDALEYVVSTMSISVFFEFDHANAVQQKQVEKQKAKAERYPLLVFYLDYEEDKESDRNYITQATVRIAIMIPTGKTWTASQRLERNFRPTLWPIYDEFIRALKDSHLFGTDEFGQISHVKRDAYFNSSEGAGLQNTMNAHLDAIQLTNLNLKLRQQTKTDCLPWFLYNVVYTLNEVTYNVSSNDQFARRVIADGATLEASGCIPSELSQYNIIQRIKNIKTVNNG